MNKTELWLPIKGFENSYEVSNKGRVRSCPKQYNSYEYKIIVQHNAKPYKGVRLYKENKAIRKKVHRLEAIAFLENPENKKCVNHKNGNKDDNILENLEWATHSENTLHAFRAGLQSDKKGTNNGRSKITEIEALEIFNSEDNRIELSQKYKISLCSIDGIQTGYSWSHITGKKLKNRKPFLSPKKVINIFKSNLSIDKTIKKYDISRATYFRIKSKRQWNNILKNVA